MTKEFWGSIATSPIILVEVVIPFFIIQTQTVGCVTKKAKKKKLREEENSFLSVSMNML